MDLNRNQGVKYVKVKLDPEIAERGPKYDETGVETYDAACRKYRALPSASFRRRLANAHSIDLKHYGLGPKGAQAIAVPMVVS